MTDDKEIIQIKMSKDILTFVEFYATLGNIDRDTLLAKILTDRLINIREAFKALPYLNSISELGEG